MIRAYTLSDLDAILQIWLTANLQAHPFIPKQYWLDHYEAVRQQLPHAAVFVYEQQGTILGFIGLIDTYIAGIFVTAEYRSKGIGKQLLDYAKAHTHYLELSVYQKNTAAYRFYLREGFAVEAEQTDRQTGAAEYKMVWNH